MNLTWSSPASTGGSAITNYKIYRGTSSGSEGLIYTTLTTGTTFNNIASIVNGTTYYYKVTAVNAVGESDFSSEVSATPQAAVNKPTPLSPGEMPGSAHTPIPYSSITFTWNKSNTGANYILYVRDITGYDDSATGVGTLVVTGQNAGDTNSYTWNGASAGKKYRWQIDALISGTEVESDKLIFVTQAAPSVTPSQILSPVVGQLEVVNTLSACSNTKWCFNQHKTLGHAPGQGVGQADDTFAWDANLNTPASDSDAGKAVYAAASGIVANTYGSRVNAGGSYGQVLLEHVYQGSKWWSGYLHMASIQVSPGQVVTENTILGYISNVSPDSIPNHLHVVVYSGSNVLGGLVSFNITIAERTPVNQPPTLTYLGQFKADGITAITEGGSTTESAMVFKGTVSDPDGDKVKLEIELRESTQAFTGTATPETISDLVTSGSQVTLTRSGLVPAGYHWQARAVDEKGAHSDWVEFGTVGNTDFTVQAAKLGFTLSPGWESRELFGVMVYKLADKPNILEIGVFNKRDMWYKIRVFKGSQEMQPWQYPYLPPYGERRFEYPLVAGEELKITVSNENKKLDGDIVVKGFGLLDLLSREFLGIPIGWDMSDLPLLVAQLTSFFNEFYSVGVDFGKVIATGEMGTNEIVDLVGDTFKAAGELIKNPVLRDNMVQLLGKAGVNTSS
ncbi:MAG: peptidoglycan DD-metalloendopeptidase family protein, partial [Dehalococcoidia bacterium]|nr:peptidoglycan DD-metalloendopeptidase family protein [Dehalococcoidia bacterium]